MQSATALAVRILAVLGLAIALVGSSAHGADEEEPLGWAAIECAVISTQFPSSRLALGGWPERAQLVQFFLGAADADKMTRLGLPNLGHAEAIRRSVGGHKGQDFIPRYARVAEYRPLGFGDEAQFQRVGTGRLHYDLTGTTTPEIGTHSVTFPKLRPLRAGEKYYLIWTNGSLAGHIEAPEVWFRPTLSLPGQISYGEPLEITGAGWIPSDTLTAPGGGPVTRDVVIEVGRLVGTTVVDQKPFSSVLGVHRDGTFRFKVDTTSLKPRFSYEVRVRQYFTSSAAVAQSPSPQQLSQERLLLEATAHIHVSPAQPGAPRIAVGTSSPSVLPGGHVLLWAAVSEPNGGAPDASGTRQVKAVISGRGASITGEPVEIRLRDGRDPARERDGVYTAWYEAPPVGGELSIEFRVDGVSAPIGRSLNVLNIWDPIQLAIVTDLTGLYAELKAGARALEIAATDDENKNQIPDYFDLIQALSERARVEGGVLVSLDQEIDEYGELEEANAARVQFHKSAQIREYLRRKLAPRRAVPQSYLAIVGSDAVVPFYRLPMRGASEAEFREDLKIFTPHAESKDTLVIRDMHRDQGYQLSDVPYADPLSDLATMPTPAFSIGRVLAPTAWELMEALRRYDRPVVLDPARANVAAFVQGEDEKGTASYERGSFELMDTLFENHMEKLFRDGGFEPRYSKKGLFSESEPGRFFDYRGSGWTRPRVPWTAQEHVIPSFESNSLTFVLAHGNPMFSGSAARDQVLPHHAATPSLSSIKVPEDRTGRLIVLMVCWAGLSFDPFKTKDLYRNNFALQAVRKGCALVSNTTGGSFGQVPLGHAALQREFLKRALSDPDCLTVGEAYRDAVASFAEDDPLSQMAAYGTILYGWPSQPIFRGAASRSAGDRRLNRPVRLAASPDPAPGASNRTARETVEISVPQLEPVQEAGEVHFRFRTPGEGELTVEPYGPPLPLVRRSVLLPPGSEVRGVTLLDHRSHALPDAVTLKSVRPHLLGAGGGSVSRPLSGGPRSLSSPYPKSPVRHRTRLTTPGVRVDLELVPLQYDPAARRVSLLERAAIAIDYSAPVPDAGGAGGAARP